MNFSRKEPTVKEQQRKNDWEHRRATRDPGRDEAAFEREEKKLINEIKKMAKEGNIEWCKILAKELVQLRKQKRVQNINKTYKANLDIARAIGTTAKTLASINTTTLNLDQLAKLVKDKKKFQAFNNANANLDMTDGIIPVTPDNMDESGDEEETEAIINKVLAEISIDISGNRANVPSAGRSKLGESTTAADKDIVAQLAKLKF